MNKFLTIGGILSLVVGIVLLLGPAGHIPLLDANRQPLAETRAEGYCAGQIFFNAGWVGDEAGMRECVEASNLSTEIDLKGMIPIFCIGFKSEGWVGELRVCESILYSALYWPTLTGTLTNSWNRAFPYPGANFDSLSPSDVGRTGERDIINREDGT